MIWLESFHKAPVNFFKALGYGYFLGYIFCAFLIYSVFSITHTLSTNLVFGLLIAVSIVGLLLSRLQLQHRQSTTALPLTPLSRLGKGALLILGVLIAAHLALAIHEAVNRPLLPWDAWTTWTYRAKIWFLNNELSTFTDTQTWLNSSAKNTYTISAHSYPSVVSLIQLWPVLVFGEWKDAVALFPGLMAGIALCFALYGQVKSSSGSVLLGMLATYLLISTPLLDAHMALPGYADIWLSGFAGLGFISLLRWSQTHDKQQLALGLAFLILGVFIKREGSVWLVSGLLFIIVQHLSWKWLISLTIALGAAVLSGHSLLTIPGMGAFGFSDGVFYLPGIGTFIFQPRDVSGSVINNLFVYDNWHLLYVYLIVLLFASPLLKNHLAGKAYISFFMLIAAVMGTIFYLSSESSWAQNSTALARLLLHVLPAWIYLLFLGWSQEHKQESQA